MYNHITPKSGDMQSHNTEFNNVECGQCLAKSMVYCPVECTAGGAQSDVA